MSWFRRRRREPSDPGDERPDPYLRPLTISDARQLTDLARQAFAEAGVEVVPDGEGALVGDHRTYGLTNFAAMVAQQPRRQWPSMVKRHVDGVLAVDRTQDQPLDLETLRDQVLVKLRQVQGLGAQPRYAPEILPGILALIAIDHPTHVHELISDDTLAELGDWSGLREIALANLRGLPAPDHQVFPGKAGRHDSDVHVFSSEDYFGAARLVLLPELLAGVGIERPSHGTVLAVPNRHVLLVHPLSGAGVMAAINLMVGMTARGFDAPGALTRELYYRSADGEAQQLTSIDADGTVSVRVAGPFEEAFQALGLVGPEEMD